MPCFTTKKSVVGYDQSSAFPVEEPTTRLLIRTAEHVVPGLIDLCGRAVDGAGLFTNASYTDAFETAVDFSGDGPSHFETSSF
jgi:hypothetical protein